MSHVSLDPYVLSEPDGTDPRITIPVSTPLSLVFVESRRPGICTVRGEPREGAPIALETAKKYIRAHRTRFAELYAQLEHRRAAR